MLLDVFGVLGVVVQWRRGLCPVDLTEPLNQGWVPQPGAEGVRVEPFGRHRDSTGPVGGGVRL